MITTYFILGFILGFIFTILIFAIADPERIRNHLEEMQESIQELETTIENLANARVAVKKALNDFHDDVKKAESEAVKLFYKNLKK